MEPKPIKLKKDGTPDKRQLNGGRIGHVTAPNPINVERKAVELIALGRSSAEICKTLDTSESNLKRIRARWEPIFKQLANVGDYKDLRVDMLASAEFEMLKSMLDPEKVKKASVNNLAYAFQQIFNSRRLEGGQSTVNTNTQSFVKIDLTDCKA